MGRWRVVGPGVYPMSDVGIRVYKHSPIRVRLEYEYLSSKIDRIPLLLRIRLLEQ